jgi:phosphoribosyl-ATP pyrophosphohydrolase
MPENYIVDDLVNKTSAMNQMRNIVYHLIKFMQEKNIKNSEIDRKLKRMGKKYCNHHE